MNNDNKSIHGFDFDLICEYFSSIKRQGPSSPEATTKVPSFIEDLNENSRTTDLGCGIGTQTMISAGHTSGQIIGLDLFPVFIDIFNYHASQLSLQDRVKGIVGSMDNPPFNREELDLIWSEGAIYNIGLQHGLKEWWQYLKIGGYIAVLEVFWFTDKQPVEINDFWVDVYPEIDTIPNRVAQMQRVGYIPVVCFILLENCWMEHSYTPQVEAQENSLKKYAGNKAVVDSIANQRHETQLYYRYKEYYGYVFYMGRKI